MGGGGAGLYASVRVKASVTMIAITMIVVRRNIALQDFTGRECLRHKGMARWRGLLDDARVIFRLAPLCTASYISFVRRSSRLCPSWAFPPYELAAPKGAAVFLSEAKGRDSARPVFGRGATPPASIYPIRTRPY